ncbi:unnamed protein product [Bemisia tabaci]|uniref:Uncharacterized protein n=1 Tax=Bemisia tabaci TaxID=7038 RepID=A0A9P0A1G3_BEMTA|nr:unnamed protein product [Bemisia tabaci]
MQLSKSSSTLYQNDPLNQEIRLIQDKLATVEKYFQHLGSTFAISAKMAARLRDQTDSVAKAMHAYSVAEFDNSTLKSGLKNLANVFIQIGTYGDEEAHLIESAVVKEITSYDEAFKPVREELKQLISLKDKQLMRRKHLDRIKERGYRNRQETSNAEVELVKVTGQLQRCTASTEDLMEGFELRKVRDLKSILQSFLKIQMRYHSKALELLTKGFHIVSMIDEELDVQEFSSVLRADPNFSARHSTVSRFPIPKTISQTSSIMSLVNELAIELPRSTSTSPHSEENLNPEDATFSTGTGEKLSDESLNEGNDDVVQEDRISEKGKRKEEEDGRSEDGGKERVALSIPIAAPRISLGQSVSANPSPSSSPSVSPVRYTSASDPGSGTSF